MHASCLRSAKAGVPPRCMNFRMALLSHTVRAYSHRVRDASALALMLKRYLEALHWAIASRQDTVVPRLVVRVIVAAPNERGTARNNATNLESSHPPHITSDIRPKPGGNHSPAGNSVSSRGGVPREVYGPPAAFSHKIATSASRSAAARAENMMNNG